MNTSLSLGEAVEYRPVGALILYGHDSSGYPSARSLPSQLGLFHPVLNVDGKSTLGAGRSLDESTAKEILVNLVSRPKSKQRLHLQDGFVESSTIFKSDQAIVWYVPPARRSLYWKCDHPPFPSGSPVSHPALVMAYNGKTFWVMAVKESREAIKPSTNLYDAPYWNVNDAGVMCWGSVTVRPRVVARSQAQLTEMFFASTFTHSNRARITSFSGGHDALWAYACAHPTEPFPNDSLLPASVTLEKWIATEVAR